MASLYAVAPGIFPTLARTAATGLALSVGRIGGAVAPWMAGILIGGGRHQPLDYLVMLSAPILLAGALLPLLRPADT